MTALLLFLGQLLIATIVIILVYQTFKYMYMMWKFKNKKDDNQEKDEKFKYFD